MTGGEICRDVRVAGIDVQIRHCVARLLVIVLACFPMAASASVLLTGEGKYAVLSEEVSYRIDEGSVLGIEEVMELASGWESQASKPFGGSGSPVTLWARFDPPAPADARQRRHECETLLIVNPLTALPLAQWWYINQYHYAVSWPVSPPTCVCGPGPPAAFFRLNSNPLSPGRQASAVQPR